MGQPNINEIADSIKDWELLSKLPDSIGEFKLVHGSGINGQILTIASYAEKSSRCRLDITYTSETFDYVPVKTVGMHTFRDIRYFCRDKEKFSEMLLAHLPELIADIDRKTVHEWNYEAADLNFANWHYWQKLPQKIGDYELYITPDNPLPYINGSYIFLDYTDFIHGNQIYFAYNTFRNEIFAEMRQQYLPLTTDLFDVKNNVPDTVKLAALEQHLEQYLETALNNLRKH